MSPDSSSPATLRLVGTTPTSLALRVMSAERAFPLIVLAVGT